MKKNSGIESEVRRLSINSGIKKVLTAVSGGADSCALLLAIKKCGLETIALHCNFNLRGEESLRDKRFVESLCNQQNIKLKTIDFDTSDYIKKHKGLSVEAACRELRYDWFIKQLKETGFERLATGHNADDNIETFFLNFCRGAGTLGLKGMPRDNGIIWRPLLNFHRKEILDYLKEQNQGYITDSSNFETDYRRNYLRNKIIPLFKEEWKGFDKSADKVLYNLYEENKVVEQEIKEILDRSPEYIELKTLNNFGAPELLIRRFIAPLSPYSTTASEILGSIRASLPKSPKWVLPKGIIQIKNKKLWRFIK